ncbi:MAG: cellulose biosynthesis protein BcsN [Hoeflea sp.]|uniref:cellulose biosynthesis protein BcsN n=1 Tax=Hoeflea sp. TaxID=1940281 RepID=UPI003EF80A46
MIMRFMTIAAFALSTSGCATGVDTTMYTGSVKPVAPTLIADVAPEYAAAYLPQVAGGIKAVRQSSKPEQVFQTILYPNPGYQAGENSLSVSIAPPSSGKSYYQAPSQREIANEMRIALPGIAMTIASVPGENLQGPFGYAIGRASGGDSCIFGWQIAEDISRSDQVGFSKLASKRYAAKLRLRYCHPSLSEAALVSLMSGLKVREVSATTFEMLRFAEGSGVSARPATPGVVVSARPVAKTVKTVARSAAKPAVASVERSVGNAPKVFKPSELQVYAGVQPDIAGMVPKGPSSLTVKRQAPTVPLPGGS